MLYEQYKRSNESILSNWWSSRQSLYKASSDNLFKEANGKCVFCEEKLSQSSPVEISSSIDHFRPKGQGHKNEGKYYWLGFSYFNLMLVCLTCNNNKRANFKVKGTKLSPPLIKPKVSRGSGVIRLSGLPEDPKDYKRFQFYNWHRLNLEYQKLLRKEKSEKPYFLNPYFDNPEDFLAYNLVTENEKSRIEVVPKETSGFAFDRAKYTIEKLDLNRRHLCDSRCRELKKMQSRVRSINRSNLNTFKKKRKLKQVKEEFTGPEARFSGMQSYFWKNHRKEWK
ncbi:hypothetical protein BST99_09615 [Aureicoccus marinus]|uniref:HNH nuclease domain-containing protein n=2 Tax=Aureicoccus marinus TaxID=754435 RepID=A0A2S7T8W0_9FLAO|nr:hypothetical protein BST99_09615 [Aureicoccus marinus]